MEMELGVELESGLESGSVREMAMAREELMGPQWELGLATSWAEELAIKME